MWTRSLYLARKLILQKRISPIPPSHKQWCDVLNFTLRMENLTYKHRGCPHKFQKIWSWWVDSNNSLFDAPSRTAGVNNKNTTNRFPVLIDTGVGSEKN